MRRRDRWQGIPWVEWMENDGGGGCVRLPPMEVRTFGEAFEDLLRHRRRYVEIERSADTYTVRVLPRVRGEAVLALDAGFLYIGTSLSNILSTACWELSLLVEGDTIYRLGVKEKARWVPS